MMFVSFAVIAALLVGIVGRNESRIFGKPFLPYYKHETRAVAPAERKVPSLSFSVLVRKQLPTPLF